MSEPTPPTVASTPRPRRVFISYGRADAQELAFRLERDFQERGHEVWLDKSQMQAGKSWEEQIEQAILQCDVFISLLTPHAVRRPDGVCLDEISLARYNSRPIIPAMVLQCRPPLGIYRLDWVDFQDWTNAVRYEQARNRLLTALDRQDTGVEGAYARLFARLRPLDFGTELARLMRDFTGREWLQAELDQWLSRPDSRVFFITGDPGTGKSAMMASLVHRHPQVAAYHFCVASLVDSLDPLRFVQSLSSQLATQFPEFRAALEAVDLDHLTETDAGALLRRLIADPLKAESSDRPMIIIVDALDESFQHGARSIARILHERLDELPSWVRLVISSRKEPDVLDLFSRFRPHEIDAARPENLQDVAKYLGRRLAEPRLAELLKRQRVKPGALAEMISWKGAGNFLYVAQAVVALEAGQLDPRRPETFHEGLVGIYRSFFERTFPEPGAFTKFRPLLDVLTAAREPLTAQQVARFLDRDVFDVESELQRVAAFFPQRGERYHAYHKSITDWLCGLAGQSRTYRANTEGGHRLIADCLMASYRAAESDALTLAHLPAHLTAAQRWSELEEVLTDLGFVQEKCNAGMTIGLIADYHAALAVWPGHDLYDPFHGSLRKFPEGLGESIRAVLSNRADPHPNQGAGAVLTRLRSIADTERDPGLCKVRFASGTPLPGELLPPRSERSPDVAGIRQSEWASRADVDPHASDTPASRVQAFATFVTTHAHILEQHPQELLPIARNSARDVGRQRRVQKLRGRPEQERTALARWQKRFKRALNAVLKRQDTLVRIEKQLAKLEER